MSLRSSLRLALLSAILVATAAQAATPSSAPSTAANLCYERMTEALLSVRNEYRSHLFGTRQNDTGGISILTVGRASSNSSASSSSSSAMSGIFETRGRLTSELIDPLVESYRVLRCRSMEVCELVKQSTQYTSKDPANIRLLGCAPRSYPYIDDCYLPERTGSASSSGSPTQGTTADTTALADLCGRITEGTLTQERAALQLAVGYDSGYRSLLQISGMMDWMLESFSSEAAHAVRDMVSMLGKLHQIPCFIGQCDGPRPPTVLPATVP